jgi:hypothetical protein
MKESQEEVRRAVLTFAKRLNMRDSAELLLKNIGVHSTIKELVFKAFLDNYDEYFEDNDNINDSIQIIRKYCREIVDRGFTVFDEKSPWKENT